MRILFFSDFHLRNDSIQRSNAIISGMIEALQQIRLDDGNIDLIIFGGDMVDCAGASFANIEESFNKFHELVIRPLCSELTLDESKFLITIGNHDVQGDIVDIVADKTLSESLSDIRAIDEHIGRADNQDLDRIESFNTFRNKVTNRLFPSDAIYETPYACHYIVDNDGYKIGISCLNTEWRYSHIEGYSTNMVMMGTWQIIQAKNFLKACDVRLAVAHHHPNDLDEIEQSSIKSCIHYNYRFLLLGHTHFADEVDAKKHGIGSVQYISTAGTLVNNAGSDSKYNDGFIVLDLDIAENRYYVQYYRQNPDYSFSRDNNYGDSGYVCGPIKEINAIGEIKHTLLTQQNHKTPLIKIKNTDEILNEIQESNTYHLVALSGLGKTRLLYEAFLNQKDLGHTYYADNCSNQDKIITEVQNLFKTTCSDDSRLILDNCTDDLFHQVKEIRDKYNPKFKLICAGNDIHNIVDIGSSCKLRKITPDDYRDEIGKYIVESLGGGAETQHIRSAILKLSDGFPYMASTLIDIYHTRGNVNMDDTRELVGKIFDIKAHENSNEFKVLMALSLFQPFPLDRDKFKLLRSNKYLINIPSFDEQGLRLLFKEVINKYNGTFIEKTDDWVLVRPFPLAIYLAEQWFERCADEELLYDLIDSIQNYPENDKKLIIQCLCRRIEYMQGNPDAEYLISRLVGTNGLFNDEKVVCSEVGSRLFLAMSDVNPLSVSECLVSLFADKSIDWISLNISGDIRRNIVWAIQKLLYNSASASNAIFVAALLSLAENEQQYSNNSEGILGQFFHIYLPGTCMPLNNRAELIIEFCNNDRFLPLLHIIFKSALRTRFFTNVHSATNKIKEDVDYSPSMHEIRRYWEVCISNINELFNRGIIVDEIASITKDLFLEWMYSPHFELILPLFENISKKLGEQWNLDVKALMRAVKLTKNKFSGDIHYRLERIVSDTVSKRFINRILETQVEINNDLYNVPIEYRIQKYREKFHPLVVEFIDTKIYKSEAELREILMHSDVDCTFFIQELAQEITENELNELYSIAIEIINSISANFYYSPFLFYLAYITRGNKATSKFLNTLLNLKLETIYLRLVAHCEAEDCYRLKQLYQKSKDGLIDKNFIQIYLENVSVSSITQLKCIAEIILSENDNELSRVVNFLVKYSYLHIESDSNIYAYLLSILKRFDLNTATDYQKSEYLRYIENLLENLDEKELAIEINRKIISHIKSDIYSRIDLSDIYPILIKEYTEVIWPDFSKAFLDENNYMFYWKIKDVLGSGFGFGIGALFEIDKQYVLNLLQEAPQIASCRLAEMIPIFTDEDNGKAKFSNWVYYFVDNFGNNPDVLSGISANIGSYSWCGSVIPLLLDQVEGFERLKTHKNPAVRTWASKEIHQLTEQIHRESSNDDFMRMHYQ